MPSSPKILPRVSKFLATFQEEGLGRTGAGEGIYQTPTIAAGLGVLGLGRPLHGASFIRAQIQTVPLCTLNGKIPLRVNHLRLSSAQCGMAGSWL